MPGRRVLAALLSAVLGPAVVAAPAAAAPRPGDGAGLAARHSPRAPVTDENFYFVMADRFANGDRGNDLGGLPADRLVSGFDPTHKGFYHGGDLKGLRERIDYIRGLGTTSIWLTPSFKNKAVQLEDGPSAGYHGYWITDFTQIDPHLGSNADLRALIDAAHARGMKVYFDIITNHTADVIGYAEGARQRYVSKDVRPYRTAAGVPFDDRDHAARRGFPALDPRVSFPYTPVLEPGEENLKVPGWLNDVTLYHNRGDTTFVGEDSLYGDFFGLDDLFTEHPRVLDGMVEIYQGWIRDFGVDGFRIDTMKHVNDEFWQKFGPRLLRFAHAHGKREFFMFGEVFDTTKAFTSHFTTTDRMQAVLDFPFQAAARDFASRGRPTGQLEGFFTADDWYTDADSNVYQLPTFLGNHDMGRIGGFIQADNPGAGDAEWLARDRLAHELMYFSRGNPVVYYGDEQGFTGPGGDQDARQSLFASQVGSYLDDDLLGTDATHAGDNFATGHPLYRAIGRLAGVTRAHPALRDGAHQHRYAGTGAGVYAFTRLDRGQQHEYVVALNNSEQPQSAPVPTYLPRAGFSRVYGDAPARLTSGADRRLTVTVPPLSTVVYRSDTRIPRSGAAP
ncbi:MAG TPA: alpha-amylase family glycosyl hydrolase, partial [Catenuloplanes sp.]